MIAVYHGRKNISGEKVAAALGGLGIEFAMITAEEIAAGGLANFSGVIFPGGHSIVLGKRALAQVRAFVRAGGGMVGICAGAQFAAKEKFLRVRHHVLRAAGTFDLRVVARHPITRGYIIAGRHKAGRAWTYSNRGRVRCRYANGGWFSAGAGVRMIVSFDEEGLMGAIGAGRFGRGPVVLLTPHPESTPPAETGRGNDSDQSQDPLALFANAVRYIGGPWSPRADNLNHKGPSAAFGRNQMTNDEEMT